MDLEAELDLERPGVAALEERAQELLDQWFALDLWPIEIVWHAKMRTRAGVAWLDERRIELNPNLLRAHPERIDEILAHELAHLVVWARHGRDADPHGPEWRGLLELVGIPATRYHGIDVGAVRTRRRRFYYLHVCQACASWWIARRVRRDRHCSRCGPGEIRILRASGTDEGLTALRRHARSLRDHG